MNLSPGLRRRRRPEPSPNENTKLPDQEEAKQESNPNKATSALLYYTLAVGCMVLTGFVYSKYIKLLHENNLWFSRLQAVEREISFRTESGFYYSFFKELSTGPHMYDKVVSLLADNRTESWRSINALRRFNIYQEVFLAILYRLFAFDQPGYERIYFYIDCVFGLHGIYLASLFAITFLVSGKISASILSTVLFILNRENATRVEYSVPLRESFAIPFIYLQIFFTCVYLRANNSSKLTLALIYALTVVFCLFWQFGQFVLMLQSFTYVALYVLELISARKLTRLLTASLTALLTTLLLQFGNLMLISSFGLHFMWISILCVQIKPSTRGLASIGFIAVTLLASSGVSMLLKALFSINDDNHIYKFVLQRLFSKNNAQRDFETGLYLCHSGFESITLEIVEKLTFKAYLLPIYSLALFYYSSQLAFQRYNKIVLLKLEIVFLTSKNLKPESVLLFRSETVLSMLFGLLACLAVRMQYLWTPSMCILASILIADTSLYNALLSQPRQALTRRLLTFGLICLVCFKNFESFKAELNDLRQFHDPHTVELMNWINLNTGRDQVFSGTMQLLASVKCCTGRRLTNHPHFEDVALREATKQIYQIYAFRPVIQVYAVLKKYGADYVIIENSACYSVNRPGNCSLKEVIDMDPTLARSSGTTAVTRRFCDEIRVNETGHTNRFVLVFENKVYRVYELGSK